MTKYDMSRKPINIMMPTAILDDLKGRARTAAAAQNFDYRYSDFVMAALVKTYGYDVPSYAAERVLALDGEGK